MQRGTGKVLCTVQYDTDTVVCSVILIKFNAVQYW